MTIGNILDALLIGPLKLVFEIIYSFALIFTGNRGLSIVALSLAMNILVLPLYRRADAMQERARDIDMKLRPGINHIKKTFKGDERMMILQEYYAQNHYSPLSALSGSVSLLLEIPFFMAAYQFLSHLDILNGVSFGPIKNLGAPDGMLVLGGITINLLPVLMTLINVISSAIYLKGFPLKTKIQLYAMAGFFLVFLYTSPSGLVFYWTLNNLFSLVKTIFYKLPNPKKVLRVLCAVLGAAVIWYGAAKSGGSLTMRVFIIGVGAALLIPLLLALLSRMRKEEKKTRVYTPDRKIFLLGAVFLTVLVGALIPSAFIASSPQEFVDISYFFHPSLYVLSTVCLAAGFFLVWLGVFYWLADDLGKVVFSALVWCMSGVMLVNYMFFGRNLGVINPLLQYIDGLNFTSREHMLNILSFFVICAVFLLVFIKWRKPVSMVLLTAVIALSGMSVINVVKINRSIDEIRPQIEAGSVEPTFRLSKTGQNVVVIMADRAMGEHIPYIMKEKPELLDKYDGFTYYSNTVSFGGHTNFGVPALMGGYDYTPVEMNKRDTVSLKDKHNESLKLMPAVFREADFEVTVFDPPYADYQWIPNLAVFDELEGVRTFNTSKRYEDPLVKADTVVTRQRKFFCLSLMKTLPTKLQHIFYSNGSYHQIAVYTEQPEFSAQYPVSASVASGVYANFVTQYNRLLNMDAMTELTEEDVNTYLFFPCDVTHEPVILQTPDYEPAGYIDNTAYDAENTDRFTVDGVTLEVSEYRQMSQYHAMMAFMLRFADWLDYLKAEGVYDNTRIIIAADHGYYTYQLDALDHRDGDQRYDVEKYYPLLLVKDFNAEGFTTDETFMTNADVPTLAFDGLVEDPVNPYTGNKINSDEKTAHDQLVILSTDYDVLRNNGTQYTPSEWASVKDDLWEEENWTYCEEKAVLTEHRLP